MRGRVVLAACATVVAVMWGMPSIASAAAPSFDGPKSMPTARGRAEKPARVPAAATTGMVVVSYEGASRGSALSTVRRLGGRIVKHSSLSDAIEVMPPTGISPEEFCRQVSAATDSLVAQPQQELRALEIVNDPTYSLQWGLPRIGVPAAWGVSKGASVTVAVLDTGVTTWHPDLYGRIDSVNATDVVDGDGVALDDHPSRHGTHVAGIIAANANNGAFIAGVAPGCTIMPVRVLGGDGSGNDLDIADGIRWAADHGADIINMSLGTLEPPAPDGVLAKAVDYALAKGVIVVAASGNQFETAPWGSMYYPAAYPDVVAVGSIRKIADPLSQHPLSTFSQYSAGGLDLVAPGEGVWSLSRTDAAPVTASVAQLSGTSMATPHVAASAALVLAANPAWSADQVVQRLIDTAEDVGPAGFDYPTGNGLVRPDLALGVGTPPAPRPSDNDVPGSVMPVAGVFERVSKTDRDVYPVNASAGELIWAVLDAPSGTITADARLLSANAKSVATGTVVARSAPLDSTQAGPYMRSIKYRAPAAGRYYLDVFVPGTTGSTYFAYAESRYETKLSAAAPKTSSWGGSATISGEIRKTTTGALVPSAGHYEVWALPSGATKPVRIGSGVIGSDGRYSFKVKPSRKTQYQLRYVGKTDTYWSADSPVLTVTPEAYLGIPYVPATVKRGVSWTAYGALKPRYPSGSQSVVVKAYRREGGEWVLRRTWNATNYYYSSTTTKYKARISLPYKGYWRIRAYVPGKTDVHAATWSASRYRTVK